MRIASFRSDRSSWVAALVVCAAASVGLLVVPTAASAADSCDGGVVDKTWEGDVSTDWHTQGNWSGGTLPGTGSDVCIPTGTPFAPHVIGGTANSASIESDQPIAVDGGTLRITGSGGQASLLHDDLNLAAGTTLNNTSSSVTIEGNLDWPSATITSTGAVGTVIIAAGTGTTTATVPDSQRVLTHQILRINGTGTFAGNDPDVFNDDTYLSNGAKIEIGSGGNLDLQGDQDIVDNGGPGANLVNVQPGGTLLRSSGTAPAYITVPVDNDGIVSAAAASSEASPALILYGGSGTQTSSGQFNPAAGAVIDLYNFNSDHAINGASFTGAGETNSSYGNLNASGTNSVASNATLALNNSILNNTGTLTVNGTLIWGSNSTIQGAGTTIIAAGGGTLTHGPIPAANPAASYLLGGQTLRVDGTATLAANDDDSLGWDSYLGEGATFRVTSGATLDLQGASDIRWYTAPEVRLQIDPGAALTKSSGSVPSHITAQIDNDGTTSAAANRVLGIEGGSPTVGADQVSTGQFSAATGAQIDFAGGYTTKVGGGAAANFAGVGEVSLTSFLETSGATSTGSSTTFNNTGGILTNTGTFTVNGTFEYGENSQITGAGTTKIASAATLNNANGDQRYLLGGQTLRIDGTATLTGDQETTGGDDMWVGDGSIIEIGSGGVLDLQHAQDIYHCCGSVPELKVLAGGTLKQTAGTPVNNRLNLTTTINGTVQVDVGLLNIEGTLTNYNATTDRLTGGTYAVKNGSTLRVTGLDVVRNSAELILDDAGSQIIDDFDQDALRNLNTNDAVGILRLRDGRNFNRTGAFTNNGLIDLASSTKLTTTGAYTQSATGSYKTAIAGTVAGTSYGQIAAGTTANLNGSLETTATYVPASGNVFDVVTAGTTRTGTFATATTPGLHVNYLSDKVRLTPPTLAVANRTVTEPDTGTVMARFRVDLSKPALGTVTASYQTTDATAQAPGDYTTTSGTVSFTAGDTTEFIDVPVVGDTTDENNERFNLTLSAPTNANLDDAIALGKITDNDPPPTASIGDASKPEGGSALVFQVTLSQASAKQVKVNYATADGSADEPGDYTQKNGTLTFAAGTVSKNVSVSSVNDVVDEDDETFAVNLSTPVNTTIADGQGTGTITDNDPPPALSVADAPAQTEGAAPHSFDVTLSVASERTVTVDYQTIDGTADEIDDYSPTSGTLTFSPGELTETVDVNSLDDSLDEVDEDFSLRISNANNATISDNEGDTTINDNDPPVSITIGNTSRSEGGNAHTFVVTLSGESGRQVTVDWTTQDGIGPNGAIAPLDYTADSDTLTFQPGQTQKTILVNSVEDALPEATETFTVELSNEQGATITDGSGLGRILNDD